ncbi:Uncharacterized protein TCM_002448 [Theobroma cacao]|uniref:Uncharacterized protein n=1 Tax=Theobroma cacao TaxID=3641 RepID=A0A061DU96_THECC|nr:Uncharacterized protein TCM_002448 [Theobroma cacao]
MQSLIDNNGDHNRLMHMSLSSPVHTQGVYKYCFHNSDQHVHRTNTQFLPTNATITRDYKDDTIDWNDDDYVGGHDDCLEEDRCDDNDIPYYNHADGDTEHTITVVLEDDQCDDPIYNNPITGDSGIRSLDDSE